MAPELSITVSLAVYKALTAILEEGQTYDDVLRDFLKLDSPVVIERPNPFTAFEGVTANIAKGIGGAVAGFHSRGLWLPNGTELRARYKNKMNEARIHGGRWLDSKGNEHGSPSAAASAITNTNVNGLQFWEAKRPADKGWRRLAAFVEDRR